MKKCPKCGCQEFYITNHVLQDWLVDGDGKYIRTEDECIEVTHFADDADWWQCADCGYDATGEKFEVKDEEETKMAYQETIKKAVQEFYDVTKAFASSRHYTLSYWWVESNFGLDLSDKKVRDDVHEMSYSDEFCDLIQTVDFDDDKKEVTIMIWASNNKKKYTLKEWKTFCKEALGMPPFEDDEQLEEWFDTHKIHITANNCVMELDYDADAVNEIEFALQEIYEAIYGDGTPTTGNTVNNESEQTEFITTNTEFKTKLAKAFETHMFMDKRNKHTVNELLYILRHDNAFKGEDFNISIRKLNGEWWTIPTMDTFVSIACLAMWFEDEFIEFEIEECGDEKFNCITIYECAKEEN